MATYLIPDDTDVANIVTFDLTVSEGHEATADVTEHPVEQGSNISDHVRQNPRSQILEMFVTNSPIETLGRGAVSTVELTIPKFEPPLTATPGSLFRLLGQGASSIVNTILDRGPPAPVRIQALTFPEPFDRIKEVHDTLMGLWEKGSSMAAVTSVRTYDTMVLTRVGMPRTEKGGATFTLDLKQIRTVTTATVKAPKPAEKRGAPKQATGSQSTKPVTDPKAESILAGGLDSLGQGIKDAQAFLSP